MYRKNDPFPVKVHSDTAYYWCTCGKSLNQPFCDGSHKGSCFQPLQFKATESKEVYFCGCKTTKTPPFCDGSHQKLRYRLDVRPDNKQIEISNDETILTASLRKNIPHLSACGGLGQCSTCRIEILSGIESCSERTSSEKQLAEKLSLPDSIRLACQTKVCGNITYRRLLLDKRDLNLNNQLIQNTPGSVGTVRNLTVLFCDIAGFTPFSESLSAYDVIFILNRYFSIMRDIIIKNGGEVNNYIGDAMMAIFGLKESRQQTAHAVNAAIQMLQEMDEFKNYLKEAYDRSFDMRIGINYGEVIVGNVGRGNDKKLTVIGDVVNIASRIEQINKNSGTRLLISEMAYEQIKNQVTVNNFLRLKLRGFSKLITLYEVSNVEMRNLQKYRVGSEKIIDGEN